MKNIHKKLLFSDYLGGISIYGIILAAGEGTRFGGLTERVPKALLPCLDKTLVEQLVDNFLKASIDSISIGVGWKGDDIKDLIHSRYSKDQVRCIDVPDYRKGPLQTLVTATESLDDIALICPVDLVLDSSILTQMINSMKKFTSFDLIMAIDRNAIKGTSLLVDENLNIIEVGEGNAKSAMMLIASPFFFEYCKESLMNGYSRVIEVIERMVSQRKMVFANEIQGKWADIDTLADLLDINKFLLSQHQHEPGMFFVPDGDHIEIGEEMSLKPNIHFQAGAKVIGPVLISGNTHIGHNTILGPNVCIQGKSIIHDSCNITDSIIFGESRINAGTSASRMVIHDSSFHMV